MGSLVSLILPERDTHLLTVLTCDNTIRRTAPATPIPVISSIFKLMEGGNRCYALPFPNTSERLPVENFSNIDVHHLRWHERLWSMGQILSRKSSSDRAFEHQNEGMFTRAASLMRYAEPSRTAVSSLLKYSPKSTNTMDSLESVDEKYERRGPGACFALVHRSVLTFTFRNR